MNSNPSREPSGSSLDHYWTKRVKALEKGKTCGNGKEPTQEERKALAEKRRENIVESYYAFHNVPRNAMTNDIRAKIEEKLQRLMDGVNGTYEQQDCRLGMIQERREDTGCNDPVVGREM